MDDATAQAELEHLRDVEMPRLRDALGDRGGADPPGPAERAGLELEGVLRRVDALTRLLNPPPPRPEPYGRLRAGDVVVLDLGDGVRPYLVSDRRAGPGDVIAGDSPLGRALLGATPGSRVRYPTRQGPAETHVLAVGPAVPPAA